MSEIVTLLFPFFGVILLGYGAGYFKIVKADQLAGLDFFVFYLALPALFIQLIAATPLASFAGWSFIGTTTFATYCAFAIAFSIGALINGGHVPEATVQGLAGSYSNTAYLAPALVIGAFGSTAAVPMALIFSFDSAMLSLAAGAAAPGALFVLGVNLALRPVARVPLEVPIIVAVKLLVHPLIVYLLLSWVGGFDPIWLQTAVLIAALPPAANVLALAQQYGVYGDRASAALLFGTAISAVTVTLALLGLLHDVLPLVPFR